MTRNLTPPPGRIAFFDGMCDRCDGTITRHNDMIVRRGEGWIHTRCAPGADDE